MYAEYADQFSRGSSRIHALDARWKLLAAFALVGAIVALPLRWWPAYVVLAVIVAGLCLTARIPARFVLRRLVAVMPFLLLIAAGVPLSLGWDAGRTAGTLVIVRASLSLTVMIILITTTRFSRLLEALARCHVPRIVIWVLAFMYRYMFVLTDELERMRRARLARTFRRDVWSELRLMGHFVGMLFVRAFERAERVYAAMCARGWNGDTSLPDDN